MSLGIVFGIFWVLFQVVFVLRGTFLVFLEGFLCLRHGFLGLLILFLVALHGTFDWVAGSSKPLVCLQFSGISQDF